MAPVRWTRWSASLAALVASIGALGLSTLSTPAYAANASLEAQFVASMNAARAAAGLPAYTVASDLVSVARAHSDQMAAAGAIFHNANLATAVTNWQAAGENVGVGPSETAIQQAFMQSPEHRANILDTDFTQVGVGVTVDGGGVVYVTEDFRQPMHAVSAPTTTTTAPTRTVSAPVSAPSRPTVSTPSTPVSSGRTSAPAPAAAPSPPPTPRQRLIARLARVRATNAGTGHGDPVAQAFAYARAMQTLSG